MLQNKVTRNGTQKSSTKPLYIETIENSFPDVRIIIGKVVSIVVAPPAAMGDKFPKYRTIRGAKSRVSISRTIFARSAIVPSSAPL